MDNNSLLILEHLCVVAIKAPLKAKQGSFNDTKGAARLRRSFQKFRVADRNIHSHLSFRCVTGMKNSS